jgi:hypothetical protein
LVRFKVANSFARTRNIFVQSCHKSTLERLEKDWKIDREFQEKSKVALVNLSRTLDIKRR